MEKIKLTLIIILFGTIGAFSAFIPMSSSALSFYRGIIAAVFLYVFARLRGRKLDFAIIKKNFPLITLIGIIMSVNWILQFESFKVASVSVGTVCYNTMPIFLLAIAPIMFKEILTIKSIMCILIAMVGVVLVSNLLLNGLKAKETIGCVYAILAAICYAFTVTLNKKLDKIPALEKIIPQFLVAAIIVVPYKIFFEKGTFTFYENITEKEFIVGLVFLIIISVIHTGLAYEAYFNVITKVNATTVAVLTYLDPVVALCLSFLVLKESLNITQIIGSILILAATLINEFVKIKPRKAISFEK